MVNVGIIGSGDVAKTLAKGFLEHGYDVMISSNHSYKIAELQKETGAKAGSFNEAANFGEIVVLSVKGSAAEKVVEGIKENLSGKTVIDTTNPLADEPPENGVVNLFTDKNESLMERLQRLAPQANFVKAFNIIGNTLMVNPDFNGVKQSMFICGNSEQAKKVVTEILEKFGFETEDFGGKQSARAIEALTVLWCIPGFLRNQWDIAFKLLKK